MAENGKKISEQTIAESLQGNELIPFAKNGGNAVVKAETIKEYATDGLDDTYATIERVNDLLDGFAPKSHLAQTDQEVSRINDALIGGLNDKVDKVTGKGLSSNDYTDADKAKLDGIEDGAQVNPTKVSQLTNDSKYQTESEVDAKIAEYAEDLQDVLDDKVDKVVGKELSTNDYTDSDKAKLTALPTNAELTATLGTKADKSTTYTKTETDNHIENRVAVLSEVWDAQLEDAFNNLDNKKLNKLSGSRTQIDKIESESDTNTYLAYGKVVEGATADDVVVGATTKSAVIRTNNSDVKHYRKGVGASTILDSENIERVTGKQLSTEDFTTALKEKLQGLTNYDDATLTAELNVLKSRLDTLVGSGDVTAVIDTFQEIEAFLQGVTNTQTLTGLLQEMKSEIVALCADTYLRKTGGTVKNPVTVVPLEIDSGSDSAYLRVKTSGINKGTFGYDSNYGSAIYNYTCNKRLGIKDDGTPHYNGNPLLYANGTSSQFLKADGSVDSTAYLPKSGGTLANATSVILELDNTASSSTFTTLKFRKEGAVVTSISSKSTDNQLYRGVPDGSTAYKIWDAGNDGANSGLDADLLDGKQPADLKVGSAEKISTTTLYDEDLNDIKFDNSATGGFRSYYAASTNTCANTPYSPIGVFHLKVYVASSASVQELTDKNGNIYVRRCLLNVWSNWKQIAFTDSNVASANILKGTQSDTEIPSPILPTGFVESYRATVQRYKDINNDYLVSFIINGGWQKGEIAFKETTSRSNNPLKFRISGSENWNDWREIAFTDSNVASADKLTTKQLTNEDLNEIKATDYAFYTANGNNSIVNSPAGTKGFYLQVYRNGNNNVAQDLIDIDGNSYRRVLKSVGWSSWQQLATTDGAVAKLTTKQLTNEDLNDVKDINFSNYWANSANTCLNVPDGVTIFNLTCYKVSSHFFQIIIGQGGVMYKRTFDGYNWQPWKKMLTEDDIASILTRLDALEARTQVSSVASLPSSPNSNTLYAISE